MLEALSISLNKAAVLGFVLSHPRGGSVLFVLFQFIYTRITPHKEFKLIRAGNVSAAVALGGAIIGFAIPASNVIAYSISLLDFAVWAIIAAVVQLLAFLLTSLVLKGTSERIRNGELAAGIYVAAVAISVGMLNAACMTPTPELIAHGAPDETKQVCPAFAGSVGRHGDLRLWADGKNLRFAEEVQLPVGSAMCR